MSSIQNYFIESIAEIKKVIWPSRKQTVDYTLLVIGLSVGVALFFGILDFIFSRGLEQLLK